MGFNPRPSYVVLGFSGSRCFEATALAERGSLVLQRQAFFTAIVGLSTLSRAGLARILNRAGFGIAASQLRVADLLHDSPKPGLLIIDAGNNPECAVNEIALFKEHHSAGRVAVIADRIKLDAAVAIFRAGANALVLKSSTDDALINLLDLVMRGETILLAELLPSTDATDDQQKDARPVINQNRVPKDSLLLLQAHGRWVPELSSRERCILRCLILGDSNKVIARKMDIAEATVKVHIKAILRKIRAHNRTQAAIWAMNNASWVRIGEGGVDTAGEPSRLTAPARVPALFEGQNLESGILRQSK